MRTDPSASAGLFLYFNRIFENIRWFFGRLRRKPVSSAHTTKLSYRPALVSTDRTVAFLLVLFAAFVVLDPLCTLITKSLPVESLLIFGNLTKLGSSRWYIVPSALLLLLLVLVDWKGLSRRSLLAANRMLWQAAAVLFAMAGSGLTINLIKRMIGRARPKLFGEGGAYQFEPFSFQSIYASFPSGHATTMGAVFVLALVYFPKWRGSVAVTALLIASTRVVIGSHYVSDIMMGLAYGAFFAWVTLVYFTRRGLGFTHQPGRSGRVLSIVPKAWPPYQSVGQVFAELLQQARLNPPAQLHGSSNASKTTDKTPNQTSV